MVRVVPEKWCLGGKQLITVAEKGVIRTPAREMFCEPPHRELSGEAEIKRVLIIQWHLPRNAGSVSPAGERAGRVTARCPPAALKVCQVGRLFVKDNNPFVLL